VRACISPCGGLILCGGEDSVLTIWNLETGKQIASYDSGRNSTRVVVACVDYHPYNHVLAFSMYGSSSPVCVLRFNKNASGDDVGLSLMEDTLQTRGNEVILNVLEHTSSRQSKSSGGKAGSRKEASSSSNYPAVDPAIQIDNHVRSWTKLRHLREMERNWKEKGQDRLYRIIQKIDSLLSKKSMFPEDVVDSKRTLSANDGKDSWIDIESSTSSNVARNISIEINSAEHRDNFRNDNAPSSLATHSRSQDDSSDLRDLAILFKTTASSHQNSPDSVGTYVIEKEIAAKSGNMEFNQVYDSSSSRVSNTTFVIENDCTPVPTRN